MKGGLVFVSAEASGDDLSVDVIREIKKREADYPIIGIGGPSLSKVGLKSPFDLSVLGIVGFAEALKIYPQVVKLVDQVSDFIVRTEPKGIVLVDSWGFSIRLARRVREKAPHIKIFKLIGPQVWATRAGRAKALAETVDHLLCIHDFEVPYYEPYGLPCTVIGNPALSRMPKGDGQRFRAIHTIAPETELVLVLPGSRSSELKRVAPTFVQAARRLKDDRGAKLEICVLVSPNVKDAVINGGLSWPPGTRFVEDSDQKADLMAAADLALACSGTITTELATQNCPMIVGYRLGLITWLLAKYFLFKAPFITLLNMAAEKEVVPELVQNDFTADRVVDLAAALLDDPERVAQQRSDIEAAVLKMGWGGEPAHSIVAETLLNNL